MGSSHATKGAGAVTAPRLQRRTRRGWHGACALSHDSNPRQARAVETSQLRSLRASCPASTNCSARRSRRTLRRARRALAPRPALRVPGARSAKGASTTGRTTTLTARSNPSNPLGRAKDFRANNWAQDDAARKSARVTIRIIGSSGEASKPNRK